LPRQRARFTAAQARVDLHGARHGGHAGEQSDGARRLADLQAGERQRAVGDELAGRHPDDPRDCEDQHQRQREQRVDGTVGDAVLHEQREDLEVDGGTGERELARCPPMKKAGCAR
jgi:hypothetical protein